MYVDFLTEEGYKPTVDSDGDVRFKKEGMTYFISVHSNDPQYFRIVSSPTSIKSKTKLSGCRS